MSNQNCKDPLLLDDKLCFALYATSRAITKRYSKPLEKLGVTYPQYLSLLVLWEKDGITVQGLASRLEIEGATATPIVQRLEKLGLVDRKRGVDDERRVYIFLTQKGMNLKSDALEVPNAIGCALDINEQNAAEMIEQLYKLRTTII